MTARDRYGAGSRRGPAAAFALAILCGIAWSAGPLADPEYEFILIEAFEVDYDLREVMLRDINEAGRVAGTSTHNGFYDGFVWTAATEKVVVPMTWPNGINEHNQIGSNGTIYDIRGGSAGTEGFLYGVLSGEYVNMTDMLPPYLYGRGWSELQDISETNAVAGRGWDGQAVRGLTWSAASGFTFLPPIPGGLVDRVYPRGINAAGTVVGFADITLHVPHAFVWNAATGMRDLNDLVTAPAGFILDWALKHGSACSTSPGARWPGWMAAAAPRTPPARTPCAGVRARPSRRACTTRGSRRAKAHAPSGSCSSGDPSGDPSAAVAGGGDHFPLGTRTLLSG